MRINKNNGEGYSDPTAHEALTSVYREARKKQAYRPLVFICSPLAGDIKGNQSRARNYCRFAVAQGAIPLAPHLLFPQFLDEHKREQRNLGIFFGLVLMSKCDEMWVFGSRWSTGMRMEIAKANARGLRIRFFDEQCREVPGVVCGG